MEHDEDKSIVVTGAAGFIGSCLVRHLNEVGVKNLVLVDHLGSTEKWKNLVGKQFVDLLDKSQLFDRLAGNESQIGTIVHLGACSSTVETDAGYLLENNYRYSVKLAEYALQHDIRFLYASSAATYGDGSKGFDDKRALDDYRPLNMYGYSKHLFDLWLRNEGVLDKVTGLKFFNVFGPNEQHKGRMASTIVHVLPGAQKEGVIRLFKSSEPESYPDGGQRRDFIYVKDVVRMIHAFMLNEATGIYNIGSGVASTWNELALAVFKALDKTPHIEYIPMPVDLIGKYQNYTCATMEKTRAAISGAAECTTLELSVSDYIRNYLIHGRLW